jgi:1-acyl-sn-glycerol-3-phosphate acyltransferase
MIPVNRAPRVANFNAMMRRALTELAAGRQSVILPEGTRRAAGAEPRYKYGVAQLYDTTGVPCLPLALNSGLFWPRRSMLRVPGTIVVEVLDPIPPGLGKDAFMTRLQNDLEAATARLVEEGQREIAASGRP